VTFPSSFPSTNAIRIEAFAFSNCKSLVEMDLRTLRIQDIGARAFENCPSLTNFLFPEEGLESISDSLLAVCTSLQEIKIPNTVVVIGQGAFLRCENLRHVSFLGKNDDEDETTTSCSTSKLVIIGNNAFHCCRSLVELLLPSTVVSIGGNAFSNAIALSNLELPEGLMVLGRGAFTKCKSLYSVSIPSTLNKIERASFNHCHSLAEVMFQEGLKTIAGLAFVDTSLSGVVFPRSLSLVEHGAFGPRGQLLGMEIPMHTDLHFVAASASGSPCFSSCQDLVNVCIPTNMDHSADHAFSQCHRLRWKNHSIEGSEFRPELLRKRFVNLPIHEVCYYASTMTVVDLSLALKSSQGDSQECRCTVDAFGMTPFHIVVTSARLHEGMLALLLDHMPVDSIWTRDRHDQTMMDYLVKHGSKRALPLIKMVLQKAIDHEMDSWGRIPVGWISDLSRCVRDIQGEPNVRARPQVWKEHVDPVMRRLARYLGIETTSIAELAVWKMAIRQLTSLDEQEDPVTRTECRMRCGSEIVLGNVMGYLWNSLDGVPFPAPHCSSLYWNAIMFDGFDKEYGDY